MTRSEAKEALWSNGHSDSNWIIDKIYNDFEEQLDMEKRKAYLDGLNDCFKALKEAGS